MPAAPSLAKPNCGRGENRKWKTLVVGRGQRDLEIAGARRRPQRLDERGRPEGSRNGRSAPLPPPAARRRRSRSAAAPGRRRGPARLPAMETRAQCRGAPREAEAHERRRDKMPAGQGPVEPGQRSRSHVLELKAQYRLVLTHELSLETDAPVADRHGGCRSRQRRHRAGASRSRGTRPTTSCPRYILARR